MDYRDLLAKLVEQRERALKILTQYDLGLAQLREELASGQEAREGLARLIVAIDADIVTVSAKIVPAAEGTSS